MKNYAWLLTLLAVAALAAVMGFAGSEPREKPGGPPPLKVDKASPLRLARPEAGPKALKPSPAGPVADNTACYCCHANYKEESLVRDHAAANVGCVTCHGPSQAHRNDEDNVTPPEVMLPPERIDTKCQECHAEHDAPAARVVARWQACCAQKTDPARIVCTDCHGEHRLSRRVVRWDKRTGKVIPAPQSRPPEGPLPKGP